MGPFSPKAPPGPGGHMKNRVGFLLSLAFVGQIAWAVPPDQKRLPIGWSPDERGRALTPDEAGIPPTGHIRSLGEWEEAESAMTLWTNPSLVRSLAHRGAVLLFADSRNDQGWWDQWLDGHQIPKDRISYFIVQTDSIWVRDYGPWYILDGKGEFGMVHNTYNRPRPNDNRVAGYLARALGIPLFDTGLVHTGGNYYSDGLDNAFSSTLVYSENPSLSKDEVNSRMKAYLGVERYGTSKLAPGATIEHLDTFGKLVTPDTWVFSDFPEGSRYRADSEAYVRLLEGLTSPYGTPYRILRLRMRSVPGGSSERYRAYLNSFISNRTLYYPIYGDEWDDEAKRIYEAAMPGYEIVGVDAENTEWGDSVHCRNRNLLKRDTLFIFPTIQATDAQVDILAEVVPSPGAELEGTPIAHVTVNQVAKNIPMTSLGERRYRARLDNAGPGTKITVYVEAKDTLGRLKTAPPAAPEMKIEWER